jgi:hypothetical protein
LPGKAAMNLPNFFAELKRRNVYHGSLNTLAKLERQL